MEYIVGIVDEDVVDEVVGEDVGVGEYVGVGEDIEKVGEIVGGNIDEVLYV